MMSQPAAAVNYSIVRRFDYVDRRILLTVHFGFDAFSLYNLTHTDAARLPWMSQRLHGLWYKNRQVALI